MRWILLLGCLLLALMPIHAGHKPPKVMLRVHVQTTGQGQGDLAVMMVKLPPDNEPVLFRSLPEVSEIQLIDIQQDTSGAVRLKFNHAGQVALSAVTAQNQGRYLVVLLNGQVIYAPVIDLQINDGELDIPHPIPVGYVQLLQEVVRQNLKEAART